MKKIYIFAAVLALLTLSLNAQLKANKKGVVQPTTTTEKVDTPPDGYFRMGPSRASTDPVTPPYTNGFSSSEWNWWQVINANNDGSTYTWAYYNGYARYHWNSSSAADDWLVTAPVVLQAGRTYTFSINAWAQTSSYPEQLEVKLASANTATALSAGTTVIASTQISSTSSTNTLSNQNVTVTTSGNYYFGIHAISAKDMYYLNVDNLEIGVAAEPEHDLAIALSAPATVGAGNTVTLTATVTNTGDFDENGYTVTFTANGNTISTQNGGALAQGASATFTTTYTTDANASSVNFGASVACTDDADASNNNATASTSLVVLLPPENVAATASDNSGTMTWDAPTIETSIVTITEGFDDTNVYPSFSIGGITATQHTGTIGDWTVYTPSSDYVYGPQNVTFNNDNDPQAWAVMNPTAASWNIGSAHSGDQFMISFCDAGDENGNNIQTTDHWLISPELSGNAQTITFFERVITTQYGSETYEVLASSTDKNPASFSSVQSITSNTTTWTQRSVSLPAGTKYFAIRHTAYDIFGVMIDDVTYEGIVSSAPLPVSYNVYLEGQLVGNVDANTFSYTFNNLEDGTYNCAVSAVYDLGESAAVPTSFTIDTTNPTIEITPATQTISDAAAATLTVTGTDIDGNINVSAGNDWSLNPTSLGNTGGQTSVTYTGRELSASTTVTASATGATDATATVDYVADLYIVGNFGNSGWDFNNGTPMSYNNGTYTVTITANAGDYILFARVLGNNDPWNTRDVFGPNSGGDWWMQGNSANGTIDVYDDDPIYFQEGGTYTITINSDGTFTITKPSENQTAPPVITSSSDGEYVTITATGNGTVTLNVPGQDPVSGDGVVSITVPCGYVSNTITVTATAQETGKDESDPTTAQITIPAGSGWVDMDGTYDDPNTLLSFLKDGEDIMMLDQFTESTLNNRHPDSYIYTLREDQPGGEPKKSTPVPIPVYKTSSTMQGFYTYNQIITDTDMHLKPQVINSKMTYDVAPDGNVLYYNLYRGNVGEEYPVIDDTHRVSKLQAFEENSQFFMFESQTSGVTPRYDHVGNEIVERLDTNYVQGVEGNEISYVPVIWTLGINSARGDGKDNSYGSDIKRETLGAVEPYNIEIERSNGSAWGKWKVPGTNQEYCVYIPTITINGTVPAMTIANDKDKSTYVPFMYRAWCTYPAARAFSTDSETGSLIDLGPMPLPHLLGTEYSESTQAVITDKWDPGDGVLQCSFGGPADEYVNYDDVTFVVRLYYKKVVTEGDNTGSKLGDNPDDAEEYYIVQGEGSADDIETALREMFGAGAVPVSVTYVNAQGMQSSQPFDGLNIVITRYSDGSTTTSKIIR